MPVTINGTTGITTPDLDSTADISANSVPFGKGNNSVATNIAAGLGALGAITTGYQATAIGYGACASATDALDLTALGYNAGNKTTGSQNTFLGTQAGQENTSGQSNTFIGWRVGYNNTTGSFNTYVGPRTSSASGARQMTTGSKNTIIGGFDGNQGGLDIRTSNNHIVLSDGDGNPRVWYDNVGVTNGSGIMFRPYGQAPSNATTPFDIPNSLGSANSCYYSLFVSNLSGYPYTYGPIFGWQETGNNTGYAYQIFHGFDGPSLYYRSGNASTGNFTGWYSFNITLVSDARVKENIVDSQSTLQLINKVRVVDFDYKEGSGYEDGKRHKGVIAQEELNNISEVVGHVGDPSNPDTLMEVKYEKYVPYLIKAVQELSAKVEALTAELNTLKGA